SGTPGTNRYAVRALRLAATGGSGDLHDLRIRYAATAVYVGAAGYQLALSHSQIGLCNLALHTPGANSVTRSHNVLVYDSGTAFRNTGGSTNIGEHLTLHRIPIFRAFAGAGPVF